MAQSARSKRSNAPHPGPNLAATSAASRPLSTLLRNLTSERLAPFTILATGIAVGAVVRVVALGIGEGFPLNDGGMFYAMIANVKHGFTWPTYTSYNGGSIPFAYPPLPFFVSAWLEQLGGWSSLDLLRYLPLLFSLLTVPAVYLLARAMLGNRTSAALAALIFATIPRSFDNEILGGGLTRSPGLFFAVLALWQGYLLFQDRRRVHLVATAILASLSILCHMEMGWFTAFSVGLFFLAGRRQREDLVNLLSLGAAVLLLTSPWWMTVFWRLGAAPFISAAQTGDHSPITIVRLLTLYFSNDVLFPVATALGLLGLTACVRDRRYLLPVWLLVIFLLDPRKSTTTSTLPIAMMAAYGLAEVVWPLLRAATHGRSALWPVGIMTFLLVIYAPIAAVASASGGTSSLHVLSSGDREAMAWIAENTPPNASFVVLPSSQRWADDATSEWFPALSHRVSFTTVQGYEWMGKSAYEDRIRGFTELLECSGADGTCIEDWAAQHGDSFGYVYISKGKTPVQRLDQLGQRSACCAPLIAALQNNAAYRLIYQNDGAVVFQKLH